MNRRTDCLLHPIVFEHRNSLRVFTTTTGERDFVNAGMRQRSVLFTAAASAGPATFLGRRVTAQIPLNAIQAGVARRHEIAKHATGRDVGDGEFDPAWRRFEIVGNRSADWRVGPAKMLGASDGAGQRAIVLPQHGLTRLEQRFYGDGAALERALETRDPIGSDEALELGLVTEAPDDVDWDDTIRVAVEERASFSPDALTGLEASLRFAGPETLETKVFARLTAWQNWIFQRPNAAGPDGALAAYGRPERAKFDWKRT